MQNLYSLVTRYVSAISMAWFRTAQTSWVLFAVSNAICRLIIEVSSARVLAWNRQILLEVRLRDANFLRIDLVMAVLFLRIERRYGRVTSDTIRAERMSGLGWFAPCNTFEVIVLLFLAVVALEIEFIVIILFFWSQNMIFARQKSLATL